MQETHELKSFIQKLDDAWPFKRIVASKELLERYNTHIKK